ncbi:MAG: type IX secretion system protein PorQ [Aureispira sp.]|nr:type IX secretion system protein PorQ [Aureispira sp.]
MRVLSILTALSILISTDLLTAQIGGNSVYEFMRLPPSARITGLGGSLITVRDGDVTLAAHNPAALNAQMHNVISFNQSIHMAGIPYGYLAYGHHLDKIGLTLHGGLQYIDYGKFVSTDAAGNDLSEFRASEYAFSVGAGYQAGKYLSFGANAKTMLSYLEGYNSTGLAFDLATMFSDTAHRITASIVIKNLGTQLSTYTRDKNHENLPLDIQIGIAHRLKYIPLRFSVIAHNLQRWGIRYDDPARQEDQSLFTDNPDEEAPAQDKVTAGEWFDNFFRHFIFNMEFLFGKKENVRVAIGYNHLRRGELTVKGLGTLGGFSFGLGVKVKQFRIDYGFAAYHMVGFSHQFGVSVNINEFKKG